MTVGTVEGTWLRVTGPFDTQLLVATVFRGGNGTEWCCREALCSHLVPCCPQALTIFFPCALRDKSWWDKGETFQHGQEKKEVANPDITLTTQPTLISH